MEPLGGGREPRPDGAAGTAPGTEPGWGGGGRWIWGAVGLGGGAGYGVWMGRVWDGEGFGVGMGNFGIGGAVGLGMLWGWVLWGVDGVG